METKETNPGTSEQERPVKKKRPEGAPRKAPDGVRRKKRPVSDDTKVVRKKRPAEARPKKPSTAEIAKRKRPKNKPDYVYKPGREAANRQKKQKARNFAAAVTKFFSYENPIVQLFSKQEADVFGDADTAKQRRQAEEERRRKRSAKLNAPAVIYTQPRAFNRNRFLIQLVTVLAVVLALVLGMSVFFKIKVITVSGANVYSAWTVRESSGIVEGDNLLTFGRTRASGQIIANLPYVKSARIGIKLPDTVNIEIEEEAVVYAIQDESSVWWLINSNGKVVEQTSTTNAKNYTKVLGITLVNPQPGQQGVATEPQPVETNEEGEYLPVAITGASQYNAALHILTALEDNDIVGSATSVDVTRLNDIILWYGTQYQVNLGGTNDMDYKIACMNDVILQMSSYQTGILDVSFENMPDRVVFTPFG